MFTGIKGGPLRRSGFNKVTRWKPVVEALGVPNLHFHDLRHTGNTLAADMGVSLRNLMARMGHDNERAALRYQHRYNSADRAIAGSTPSSRPTRSGTATMTTTRRPDHWCR